MTMKIVVGLDGSDQSMNALRWAAHEAGRRSASISAVSCFSLAVYGSADGMMYPRTADFDLAKEGAEAVVDRAIAVVRSIDSTLTVDGVTQLTSPVLGITESAEPGDEIVIGATGHGGFPENLLGSVASGVVHKARVPVIVVPAKWPGDRNDKIDKIDKIVVGVDGSPGSLQALEWAYSEAALAGAELTVVHGWSYPYSDSEAEAGESQVLMKADAMAALEASVDSLGARREQGPVTIHPQLSDRSPVEALLEAAADADLLVVGSRGRGGFLSMLLGSTSRTVVQHSPCPVAVIRRSEG